MRTKLLRSALAVGAGAALIFSATPAAHATTTSTATKAIDWLEGQMSANGHRLKSGFTDQNNQFQTFDDAGLTIDGLLAIAAAKRDNDTEAKATRDWMLENVDNYVTGFDPDSLYAGALGKAIVFALVYDQDPNQIDGHDLEADLRGRMQSNGRFTDKATDFESGDPVDYSNGIGDALDVLALAGTEDGAPAAAVNYLLLQQCPNGGFRETLGDAKCTDTTKASADATSFALMALDVVDLSDAVDAAIDAGAGYLASVQGANGAFKGAGNSDSANSSGLAGAVLRGLGDAPRANKAATYVKSIQLASGSDNGAILGNKADYDDAVANGLDAQGKTLAARSTAQGVLALGLPMYPLIGSEPVEPSTTITLSSNSVPEGGTLTVSGGGFETGEKVKITVASDPVTVGEPVADGTGVVSQSFTLPASIGAGSHTVTLLGETSGVTISAPFTVTAAQTSGGNTSTTTTTAPRAQIVRTGSGTHAQAQVAFALLAFGGVLVLVARRRRIVYPFQK
jgi:prenyltransferase beta subunit